MRILSCSVQNFASYDTARVIFENRGLCVVHGHTGSGKSTLQDMVCWTLYGITSKNGTVDEVRSWTANNKRTIGELEVELPCGLIQIVRVRGESSENDLFWWEGGKQIRGKDIKDTQALLNCKLGVDADLYLTAAYASEFSPTGNFFLAKAKDRRAVLETICDMDFPVSLAEKAAAARKQTKTDLMTKKSDLAAIQAQLKYVDSSNNLARQEMNIWQDRQHKIIEQLERKSNNFTQEVNYREVKLKERIDGWDRERTERLHDIIMSLEKLDGVLKSAPQSAENKVCPACGTETQAGAKNNYKYDLERFKELKRELQRVQETPNPYMVEPRGAVINPYAEQVEIERTRKNPHNFQLEHYLEEIKRLQSLSDIDTVRVAQLEQRFDSLAQLADLSSDLRGVLLTHAVSDVQRDINRRLSKFFDAEISVAFKLHADELEVGINKNGYACTFTQLSKGQRQLLRLCFMTSMMEQAAANAGVHFGLLCFDESLDGLDAELKVKAFPMFEELAQSHESVLVIEHSSEFKNMFSTQVHVTLENDRSIVEVVN